VYAYMISCALDAGMTIEKADVIDADLNAPANDDHCTDGFCVFGGSIGLATDWQDRKLSNAGQGWVSACLFARSNFYDTAAEISLRGRHPSLTITAEEASLYTLQEGAFYGNVFTGESNPIEWFACQGSGEYAGLETGGLALRDCTEPDPGNPGSTLCGFTYTGTCASFGTTPSPYACRTTDAAGNYTDCYEGDGPGHWGGLKKYRQVITTNVSAE